MRHSLLFALLLACGESGTVAGGGPGGDASPPAGDAGVRDASVAGDAWTFGEEHSYQLTIDDEAPPPLMLSLDRGEVEELLGPVADELVLLELDPVPFLTNALNATKSACGETWQEDDPDPRHDCGLTALGGTFEGPDGTWRTSAEYSLVRLLTMTPANAAVEGTSIEFLQLVADQFDIGGGFAQILSDTLEIDRTEEFLTTDVVVASLKENLLETHPNIGIGGRIEVTLRDALDDMAPLAERLGRVGDHPGILDPQAGTYGEVLGPDFRMRATTDSNIRVLEGLDLSGDTKEYLSTLVDVTGPTFDDPIEFDFLDPDRFALEGLSARATIDLRFFIRENIGFANACTGEPCKANRPESPVGVNTAWYLAPWELEYVIAWAGLGKYGDLRSYHCYPPCAASEVAIGQDGDPAGWAHFGVPLELGPKDQYVWELINEVAQTGLHKTPYSIFEEGDANVAFDLKDIDVGLTAEDAAERVRPFMQRQAHRVAEFLLGDFRANNGRVDLYYRRGQDFTPALFYLAPEDLQDGVEYVWTRPGFYADPALSEKVSATELEGFADTAHEKWVPPLGESVVYVSDDTGDVFRLRVVGPAPADPLIDVHVARASR